VALAKGYVRANGSIIRVTTVITAPHGTDISEDDRLELNGRTYEVVGFLSDGEWETALRCMCREAI
jgi:SPP1 family predicted phage head-tail adaptor